MLHIEPFALGEWMTNCYVLHPQAEKLAGQPCWIVDAGYRPGPMIDYIRGAGLDLRQVVLTHGHLDHIAGLHAIRGVWPEVPILVHEGDREFLTNPDLNLSEHVEPEEPIIAPPATGTLEHGQKLALGDITFEVRHTPGHSPGGISLYQPEAAVVLVGDVLFAGGVGRTDFSTSDQAALMRSIETQLLSLPDPTRVLSGHGPATTIGQERKHNPFLRGW